MKHITTLLPITSILSIAFLAGCTTTQTANTNEPIQVQETITTEITSNSDATADVAENTNSDEVDMSDRLTYTNEEYGFSFLYPKEWKVEQNESYIGVYNPETYILAKQPNNTNVIADISINLFTNIDDAPYVEGGDLLKSLQDSENKKYIKNLLVFNAQKFQFIEHNAYFDEDEVVYYFLTKEQIISFTFFDNDSFNIKQKIMQSVILN